jgi:ATP-dependent DNA helicase RecG
MINKEELKFILNKGESYFIEFKEKLDKSFLQELVAFSNASGGKILLGINDQNHIRELI